MAKFKRSNFFQDNIQSILLGSAITLAVFAVVWFLWGRNAGENGSQAQETEGDVYVCGGCGKEYINQFPYTSPWVEYPTELPAHEIVDMEETSYNDAIDGATPVVMFQRVTGNLSSRDDKDFYRFTIDVAGSVRFYFSFDGSSHGYTYLWDGTVYGIDGTTVLNSGVIPIKEGEEVTFGTGESDLEPGTYYLMISVASGGNPFMNGYSDTDYHITFRPKCTEHTSLTQTLTAAPTCFQAGELITVCNMCGEQISVEVLESLDHIWSIWKLVEESFFSSIWGNYSRVCALCGEEEIDTLLLHFLDGGPKTDPDAVTVIETRTELGTASCASEVGVKTVCSVCGNVEVESKEATEHTYGEWVTSHVSTCSVAGQRRRVCAACGHVETETLEQVPHTFGKSVPVSGSILNAPIVSQKTCMECGYVSTVEIGWSRWILPAIVVLSIAISVVVLAQVPRIVRRLHGRAAQKQREKAFLCPYCFNTGQIGKVEFRCSNKLCKDVPDLPMTKYENGDSSIPLVGKFTFKPTEAVRGKKFIPRAATCPECHQTTHKIICTSCHNLLPESVLLGEDMIISIVGSRDTGKSHFVGVIVNELIERIAPAFGGSFEGFDDTMERYEQSFGRKLYVDLQKLDLTQSSLQNVNNGAYRPLIFSLKLQVKKGLKETINRYTLVFFDTAGEDLEDADTMSTVNKYICKSAGIIFLLDPMKIPAVATQLDEDVIKRASSVNWQRARRSDDILVRVSNLIRNDRSLKSSDKIDVPVAVVFSKFDAIEPIIPQGCAILTNSPHCKEKAFVLSDWHNVNSEVQGLLRTWGAESFLSQLEVNYTNYSCFAVSSLGLNNNPTSDMKINRPRPHRIEDPLLWILMKLKVIRSKK